MELERLITKWRRASRDAAEEVFAETRDRVNKMGGVRGWKEREREGRERTREFQREWDGEGEKARRGDGDEGDGEDRDGEGQGEREERKFAEEEDGCGEVRKEEEEVVDEDEVCFSKEIAPRQHGRAILPVSRLSLTCPHSGVYHGYDASKPEHRS